MLHKYLPSLSYRSKWKTNESKVGINDLVLKKGDNVKYGHLPLARVVVTHLGQDGIFRVGTVRKLKATYKQSIVKIYQLENDAIKVFQDMGMLGQTYKVTQS